MDGADVKAFFERVSVEWDEMRSSFYNEAVIDALAERAEVDGHTRVVDVGTGTGFVAAGLAPRAASVVGVASSPAMLAAAADNLHALGLANVTLVEGTVDALPLDDDSVDAAVANMCSTTRKPNRHAHRDGQGGPPRRHGCDQRRGRARP